MRNFQAYQWLQTDHPEKIYKKSIQNQSYGQNNGDLTLSEAKFAPSNFLIPGWNGASLFSKSALNVKISQEKLWKDAYRQFLMLDNPNRSFKTSVYNEFQQGYGFLDGKIPCELNNIDNFWRHLKLKNSPHRKNILRFVEIYTFRVATVFLYKAKFLTQLSDKLPYTLDINKLRSPNSTLSKLFPKGSSLELNCKSLQSNQYSWFRPSHHSNNELESLLKNLKFIDISQLIKLSTYRGYKQRHGHINFKDQNYSHALSHCSFGKFINTLMVFFPIWYRKNNFSYPQPIGKYPAILNTVFEGDKISSLCHSHWLAQENNLDLKWSEIISPLFLNHEGNGNSFTKICHEIHFLTFLVSFAKKQNYPIREIICHVFKQKFQSTSNDPSGQFNLFNNETFKSPSKSQRILLNLTDLPKKNPFHYLTNKILSQKDRICPNGHLFVLTNQNLFVPSQSAKLKQLLETFSIDAKFSFENLVGKGELASYIYVLKFRDQSSELNSKTISSLLNAENDHYTAQESCLNFSWKGDLSHFGHFDSIVSSLFEFFQKRSPAKVSMNHAQITDQIVFEYHHDAIIDGKLLSSNTNNDEKNITHPNFFQKLTQNCYPLEHFFLIESLDKKNENVANDLLGINFTHSVKYPYVLMADLRDPLAVKVNIIPIDSYEGMKEKMGSAYFRYFGITPKFSQMNINLFKEYFQSDIGKQITRLSIGGGNRKIKAKISSMLIPKFFSQTNTTIAEQDQEALGLIKLELEELMRLSPSDIRKSSEAFFDVINKNDRQNPWIVLSILSQFKSKLSKFDQLANQDQVQFSNPLILRPLLELESHPLHPNKDIFLKLSIEDNQEIHLPLTKLKRTTDSDQETLILLSGEKEILSLFAEKHLLNFIQYVLSKGLNCQISQLISSLKVPSALELERIITNFDAVKVSIQTLKADVESKVENIIKSSI